MFFRVLFLALLCCGPSVVAGPIVWNVLPETITLHAEPKHGAPGYTVVYEVSAYEHERRIVSMELTVKDRTFRVPKSELEKLVGPQYWLLGASFDFTYSGFENGRLIKKGFQFVFSMPYKYCPKPGSSIDCKVQRLFYIFYDDSKDSLEYSHVDAFGRT